MKMKKIFYLMFALIMMSATSMNAQVAIGTNPTLEPRPGTILDLRHVSGNNMGLLLPKVTLTDAKIWAPVVGQKADEVDGMMVFNESTSTENGLEGKGVYVWVNGSWNKIKTPVIPTPPFIQDNPNSVSICYGTTTKFTLAEANGGSGDITYIWEQRATEEDPWVQAVGTFNKAEYTTPALTSDMYYRRTAEASVSGGTIESNPAKVKVISFTQTDPEDKRVCYGGTTPLNLGNAVGGSESGLSTITYQWQESLTGADDSWKDATGTSTNASYTTPSLYVDTYYRRLATCDCGTIESNNALVTVPSTATTGKVTSSTSGYTYAIYEYPDHLGLWTENIREPGFEYDTYPGRLMGERGYYYDWGAAKDACKAIGDGYELPTEQQWTSLGAYVLGSQANSDDKAFFECGNALAGFKASGSLTGWSSSSGWWSYSSRRLVQSTSFNPTAVTTAYRAALRCVKPN